jgi:hypothetical protein
VHYIGSLDLLKVACGDKTSEKRKAEIEVFGINLILKMLIEINLI